MKHYPTDLKLTDPNSLQITWSDGAQHVLKVRHLRDHCPCATCREKRRADDKPAELLPILKPEETAPLRITSMRPIGNYAYSVAFSDGHDTGIYTFEWLRQLSGD